MENLCTGNARVNRLSTLAQAADCLAKAAITLSEAARAAAESFSSELLDIPAVLNSLSEETPGYELGGDERGDEERTNPDDTNHYLSDEGEPEEPVGTIPMQHESNNHWDDPVPPCSTGPMSVDQLRFDPNRPPRATSVTTEIETEPGVAYRVLVEQEADVLLFVCALIQHRRKVICYMNCSIPTFHMYKRLINDVTATNVHTITKTTTAEITQVGQEFLEADRSILLLPETTTPSIEIDDIDSWVIHVGWPSDEQRYEERRLIHQAQNSIIVACSEDEELYPAGTAIMWQSQPWPGDVDSFRVSVALLRPVFDQKLSFLPPEMKAKVYPDWISCHGPRGHRHVKSWDATTLILRANSFLHDVLKYKVTGPNPPGSDPQIFLPEVSEGFVAHNGLESAVGEGVLRVKVTDSGLNHVSSLPSNDWTEPSVSDGYVSSHGHIRNIHVDQLVGHHYHPLIGLCVFQIGGPPALEPPYTPTALKSNSQMNSNSQRTGRQGYVNIASTVSPSTTRVGQLRFGTIGLPAASLSFGNSFKPTPGHTYFTIDEDYDAIPLMCFLATTCVPTLRKVILFFNFAGCRAQYQTLFERITGWRVFTFENKENGPSSEEVASEFAKLREPAILFLHYKLSSLPYALNNVPLGYCIYWSSTLSGATPFGPAQKHQTSLRCEFTSIIITTTQASKMNLDSEGSSFREHPSSVDFLHRYDSPWLSDIRTTVRLVLSDDPQLVSGLYETHLEVIGKICRHLGAEEIANRVNKFVANVLLAGEAEDGSKKYPPIASRPMISPSIINELYLQAAVDAGLLLIRGNILSMLPNDCHENQAILLSHATECLSKAAIALSEAAEAMAAAAKSFIPGITSTVPVSQPPSTTETNNGINAIVDYESDSDSSPTIENLPTPVKPTNNARGQRDESEFTTDITGKGSTLSDDEEYLAAQSTGLGTQTNAATQSTTTNAIPETETETQLLPPSYQILLDDEADVLLAACSLIRKGRKIILYVRSSITALDVYEAV
ncbi:unnamed protein product, partial [Rhizoctonia solani]